MTFEELYLKEKVRIEKLSRRYARMFEVDAEDLSQEGSLAIVETYYAYGKLPEEELLKISHRIVNRKIYKYARKEFKQKEN